MADAKHTAEQRREVRAQAQLDIARSFVRGVLAATAPRPNPMHVSVGEREYSVYFNDAGKPQTVMVHKKHHQTARLNINGPTARAAIAKASA